jgi:DNA-nicking Smr family endonuclease
MTEPYDDDAFDPMAPVEIPITGTLDLHPFKPAEVPDLIGEYIAVCREKGILSIRLIHGKGKGIQKDRVRSILTAHPHVLSFTDGDMGNWGATCVELMPR